ncbi:MAG: DUF805 domain-containing protein [Rhodocyclaceae bacterium]|nr:DUF805 domain-containing protein [Rhodocyclaceae bacterium]
MSQYKIIFAGETLPGHDPDVVREQLAKALNAGPAARERLFSGRPVSLKSGLDADQAQRYRRRLAAMGVGVRVEAQDAPAADHGASPPAPPAAPALALEPIASPEAPADAATPEQPAEDALALVASVLSDRTVCPQCGHEQPKRTLCQSCGADMVRMAAARAAASGAQASPSAASEPARDADPQLFEEAIDDKPKLIGFSFEGRMPRLSYLLGGLALILLTVVVMSIAATLGPILAGIAMVVMMVPMFRMSVMRLHDFNWSGWWSLLLFVPFVGNLVALILMFMPGTDGANDYGNQTESHGWKPVLITLAVCVAGMIVLVPMSLTSYQGYVARAKASESARYLAGYDPAVDQVFLFTIARCGACELKRKQFDEMGVVFTEMRLDEDPELGRLVDQRLAEGPYRGAQARQLPFVEVNGTLLPNNPDLQEISQHFGGR